MTMEWKAIAGMLLLGIVGVIIGASLGPVPMATEYTTDYGLSTCIAEARNSPENKALLENCIKAYSIDENLTACPRLLYSPWQETWSDRGLFSETLSYRSSNFMVGTDGDYYYSDYSNPRIPETHDFDFTLSTGRGKLRVVNWGCVSGLTNIDDWNCSRRYNLTLEKPKGVVSDSYGYNYTYEDCDKWMQDSMLLNCAKGGCLGCGHYLINLTKMNATCLMEDLVCECRGETTEDD